MCNKEEEEDEQSNVDQDLDTNSYVDEDNKRRKKKKGKKQSLNKKNKKKEKDEKSVNIKFDKGKGKDEAQELTSLVGKHKELGMKFGKEEKPYCHICEKVGHMTTQCWYNPHFRGNIPPGTPQRSTIVNQVEADVPDLSNQGWYQQDHRRNWGPPSRGNLN